MIWNSPLLSAIHIGRQWQEMVQDFINSICKLLFRLGTDVQFSHVCAPFYSLLANTWRVWLLGEREFLVLEIVFPIDRAMHGSVQSTPKKTAMGKCEKRP